MIYWRPPPPVSLSHEVRLFLCTKVYQLQSLVLTSKLIMLRNIKEQDIHCSSEDRTTTLKEDRLQDSGKKYIMVRRGDKNKCQNYDPEDSSTMRQVQQPVIVVSFSAVKWLNICINIWMYVFPNVFSVYIIFMPKVSFTDKSPHGGQAII